MTNSRENNRKKAIIALVGVFMVLGGVLFIFSVFQSLGDLREHDKTPFVYGYTARGAALPLFQYFGLAEEEKEQEAGRRDRGMDLSRLYQSKKGDVSDWMAKPGASSAGAASSSASASAALPVPSRGGAQGGPPLSRLAASAGFGAASGGGSRSAADKAAFSGGDGSGNLNMSGGKQDGGYGLKGKGAMGALASARAVLSDGLRSGSALTARAKWGQAFGVGSGGQVSDMSYGKSGLVGLDKIQSGIPDSLKETDIKTLKPTPVEDPELTKKDIGLARMQGKTGEGQDAAKEALKSALGQMGGAGEGGGAPTDRNGNPIEQIPQNIQDLVNTPPPQGIYCPSGCQTQNGSTYIDSPPRVTPDGKGGYTVSYSGTQNDKQGNKMDYTDRYTITGNPPELKPIGSTYSCNGAPPKEGEAGDDGNCMKG